MKQDQNSGVTPPTSGASQLLPAEIEHLNKVASHSLLTQFAEVCEGALIVDRQSRIVWMNEKYPKRLGLKDLASVLGQPVESILPNSQMREVVESGRPIMLDIMEFHHAAFVVLRLPLRDATGSVIGAIGLMLLEDAKGLAPLVSRYQAIHRELADTRNKLAEARRAKHTLSSIVGTSEACLLVKAHARRAARTSAPVLIQGETGTGKELLAQAIHNASFRADKPFVAVNIAAIPEALLEAEFFGTTPGAFTGADRRGREGKFELANGGTLFLDEIGDMPSAMQAKLLRVLQEGEYEALGSNKLRSTDTRIVAATSRDLQAEMAQGRFRPDLYYRLNVVTLTMPPLRERMEDLATLCDYLLDTLSQRMRMAPHELDAAALARLRQHHWPGNIRELQNVLERALMMCDTGVLGLDDVASILPAVAVAAPALPEAAAQQPLRLADIISSAERQAISAALKACGGNKAQAATRLGISRTSFYEKLASLQLA